LGENFDVTNVPTVTFNDKHVLKDGNVQSVSATELVVKIPAYPEHNEVEFPYQSYSETNQKTNSLPMGKTSKGTLIVKAEGTPIKDCRDVDPASARRVFPFSYSVGWPANPPLLASDFKQNRIVEIDPDTGIAVTRIDKIDGFPLEKPYGIDVGPDGTLYVAIGKPSAILRYNITGQFLGVWANNVPGEPRGIRWLDNHLYVCSWKTGRVLQYKYNAARVNFASDAGYTNNVGSYRGFFTNEPTHGAKLRKPYELRFHSLHGARKLFVSSAEDGQVLQFDGFNGNFEKVFTSATIPSMSGFAFSSSHLTTDLFGVGFKSGRMITRFHGVNGTFISHFKDRDLGRNGGIVIHDDSMYVTSGSEIRQYSITTGRLVRISTVVEGAALTFVTIAAQCN